MATKRMKVMIVPVLNDNYSYLLIDEQEGVAAAVDPAEPSKVQAAAAHAKVKITAILTTHYHKDHSGGNEELKKALPDVLVYGGALDNIPACTNPLRHGDTIQFTDNIHIRVLHTPCHTKGHVCYYAMATNGQQDPAIFTGDTLFVAGCGRFFEGTAHDMYKSLCKTIGALPPATKVYCGHEYTVKNLQFALTVEPRNHFTQEKLEWAEARRAKNLPTVPSTLAQELKYNPFMRVDHPGLATATQKEIPEDVLAELRTRKDYF